MRGAQRVAQPLRVTKRWLEVSVSMIAQSLDVSVCPPPGFGNVHFWMACTIDSLLSASVGSPGSGDAGSGAVGI